LLSLRGTCKYLLAILDEDFLRFEVFFHGSENVRDTLERTVCRPNNISINFGFFDRDVIKALPKTIYSINMFMSAIDDDSLLLVPPSLKVIKLDFCKRVTNQGLKNLFSATQDSLTDITLRGNLNITSEGLQFLTNKITHLCLLDVKPISDKGLKHLPHSLKSLEITCNHSEMRILSPLPVFQRISILEIDGTRERDTSKDTIDLPPNLYSLTVAKHFLPRIAKYPRNLKRFFVTGGAEEIPDKTLDALPSTLEVLNVGKAKMSMRRLPIYIERLSTLTSMDQLSFISNFQRIKLLIISGDLASSPRCFEILPRSLTTLILHKATPEDLSLATLPSHVTRLNMTFRESTPSMSFEGLPSTVRHLTISFERDSSHLDLEELASFDQLEVLELFSRMIDDDEVMEVFEESPACVRLNGVWILT